MKSYIEIHHSDYWFKVVEMLQQNWALIETTKDGKVIVYFISDTSSVFDKMEFSTVEDAKKGLQRNGFEKYNGENSFQMILNPPEPPFEEGKHPNRPIYSSGKFWR